MNKRACVSELLAARLNEGKGEGSPPAGHCASQHHCLVAHCRYPWVCKYPAGTQQMIFPDSCLLVTESWHRKSHLFLKHDGLKSQDADLVNTGVIGHYLLPGDFWVAAYTPIMSFPKMLFWSEPYQLLGLGFWAARFRNVNGILSEASNLICRTDG